MNRPSRPTSSSPRRVARFNGLLGQTASPPSPIRLPSKQAAGFIASFNQLYQSLGMEVYPLMSVSAESLTQKKCLPCEGGVDPITGDAITPYMIAIDMWELKECGKMISRKINTKNFAGALDLVKLIGDVAESQQHHPDLHLTGYRHVTVDLTTHAIGGLSENDFIVAAKIDQAITQYKASES